MTMALYFFIALAVLSFVELAALFGYRAWEMRRGHPSERGQVVFAPTPERLIRNALTLEQVFLTVFFYALRSARHLSLSAYRRAVRHPLTMRYVEYLSDVIKGKRILNANGTASAFLQTISSHKDRLREEERRNGSL